jgi:hypothetical protein
VAFDLICSDGLAVACASIHVTTRNGVQMSGNGYDGLGTELIVRMRNHQGHRAAPDNMIWSRLRDFEMSGGDVFGQFVDFGTSVGGHVSTEGNVPTFSAAAFAATADPWDGGPLFGVSNWGAGGAGTAGGTGIIDLWDFFSGVGGAAYYTDIVGCAREATMGAYTAGYQTCVRDADDVLDGIATEVNDPWVTVGWQMSGLFNVDDPGMRYSWNLFGVAGTHFPARLIGATSGVSADGPIPGVQVSFSARRTDDPDVPVDGFSAFPAPSGFLIDFAVDPVANANGFNTPTVTATPEPATVGLMATGLVALGAAVRRRRR